MKTMKTLGGYEIVDEKARQTKASYYASVAAMKADTALAVGMSVVTNGYYSENDGGGATYIIRAKVDGDDDNYLVQLLSNGLVAEMVVGESVTPEMFGAKRDGVTDDRNAFYKAAKQGKVTLMSGTYKVSSLTLDMNCVIEGKGINNTKIMTDGIVLSHNNCKLSQFQVVALTNGQGSGITFGNGSSYSCLDHLWVFNFNVAIDASATSNHVVSVSMKNVVAGGHFAGFKVGASDSTFQTNGVWFSECYAVNCGDDTQDFTKIGTDGYGYGFYIFGGYSITLDSCIAEYCSGGGVYISSSSSRPSFGLSITNMYCENNKIAQIYVDDQNFIANCNIDESIATFDDRAKTTSNYKRPVYLRKPQRLTDGDVFDKPWGLTRYKKNTFVRCSLERLVEESQYRYNSIFPISSLDTLALYTDNVGVDAGCCRIRELDGENVVSAVKGFNYFGMMKAKVKANQIYNVYFEYRRTNDDDSDCQITNYMHDGERINSFISGQIPYTDSFKVVNRFVSFPTDMVAEITQYFNSISDTSEVVYRNFRMTPVDFAVTDISQVKYPQNGFVMCDSTTGNFQMYKNGTWYDMNLTAQA